MAFIDPEVTDRLQELAGAVLNVNVELALVTKFETREVKFAEGVIPVEIDWLFSPWKMTPEILVDETVAVFEKSSEKT